VEHEAVVGAVAPRGRQRVEHLQPRGMPHVMKQAAVARPDGPTPTMRVLGIHAAARRCASCALLAELRPSVLPRCVAKHPARLGPPSPCEA
jgi:hypothetical protein